MALHTFAYTNSEYLINLKATIKAKHKKTLATQNIVVTSIKQPFATEESFPVLIDCAGIGSTTHNEIPSELRGQLTISNGYEIGFKRRFTDLLDDYVLVNQEIVIDVIDNNTGETYSSNTAVINSVDFNPNNSTANISVTKRALETHELNYTIKDGVNVIDGAQGQILPVIFGEDKQVKPVRMTKNIWGYGTNLYDANGTKYAENGTPTIYAADSNGYLTEVKTAPGTGTTENTCFVDWDLSKFDYDEEYPYEGLDVAFKLRRRCFYPDATTTYSEYADKTGYILNQVQITFEGRSTISTVNEGEFFTIEIWEGDFAGCSDWTQAGSPSYRHTTSLPGKMIASSSVSRKDYETEIKTDADFAVHFILDKPVPFTVWPGASSAASVPALEKRNNFIVFKQGYSAVTEAVFFAKCDYNYFLGLPQDVLDARAGTEAYTWDLFYKTIDTSWSLAGNVVPLIRLYGCVLTSDNLTPAEVVSEGLATITPADGLTPSIIKITSNTLSGSDTLTYNDLNLVVEVDGLSKVGATACATTPAEQTELLLSYYASGAWTNTAFDSTAFSSTHSPAIYSRSPEAVLTGMTLSRDALGEMLFWHHGKLFQTETNTKKLGLFLFGTVQALAAIISEEDCIIDRVQELDLSTVVNNPSFQFGRKLMALSPVGLSSKALKFQDYFFSGSTSGYQLGSRQEDSQTLFGTNLMRKNTSEWIGENTTARNSAMLLVERYALPAFYILIRVPLRRYNDLNLGDVVLLSHSNLPYIGGGDASSFDAALYDGSALSDGAANGAYQVSGKSYKCLIEGRELYLRNGEPPMLKLSLLSLHNTGEGII